MKTFTVTPPLSALSTTAVWFRQHATEYLMIQEAHVLQSHCLGMTSLELYQDLRHKTSRVVLEWHHLVLTSRWSVQLFWHNSSTWWRHRRTPGHGIYLHYITLLAKDSDVTGKPLQLGRTYHRRRTLRKTKTAGKATGNHPCKYVIRETVSMQLYHSAV